MHNHKCQKHKIKQSKSVVSVINQSNPTNDLPNYQFISFVNLNKLSDDLDKYFLNEHCFFDFKIMDYHF